MESSGMALCAALVIVRWSRLSFFINVIAGNLEVFNRILIYIWATTAALFILSCSNFVGYRRYEDPQLTKYVDDYYNLVAKNCNTNNYNTGSMITVEFAKFPKDSTIMGVCHRFINGYKIQINRAYWDNELIADEKLQLLFHELAHCVIYKEHVEDKSNYMNAEFYYIQYEKFIKQVTADIRFQCRK